MFSCPIRKGVKRNVKTLVHSPSRRTDLIFCPTITLLSSDFPAATIGSLFKTSCSYFWSSSGFGLNCQSNSTSFRSRDILRGFLNVIAI